MATYRVGSLLLLLLTIPARTGAAGFAMSDNFTVFTPTCPNPADTEAFAREVLHSAEAWRKDIARHWLGEELPPSVGQTTVNVAFSTERDAGVTWVKDDPQRQFHTLYMTTSPDRAVGSTLAHEMVHVVLATRYPHPHRLPAWLEEGIASRYDDEDRQAARRQIIAWMEKTNHWPALVTMLQRTTIPDNDKQTYAVASSLTDYLLTRADQRTLLDFGDQARTEGWDTALNRFYHIRNVAALQAAWQRWASQPDSRTQK
jgi:hypothetical protein